MALTRQELETGAELWGARNGPRRDEWEQWLVDCGRVMFEDAFAAMPVEVTVGCRVVDVAGDVGEVLAIYDDEAWVLYDASDTHGCQFTYPTYLDKLTVLS